MNVNAIRLEAVRFCRRPKFWVLFGVYFLASTLPLPLLSSADRIWLIPFGQPLLVSLALGFLSPSWSRPRINAGTQGQLAESEREAASRSQIVARWLLVSGVAGLLWAVLLVGFAARGQLSAHTRVAVLWQSAAVLQQAGRELLFEDQSERNAYQRWSEEGQRPTYNRVRVHLPWAAATVPALGFLAFLLGVASQSVREPDPVPSRRRFAANAMPYVRFAPLAVAVLAFLVAPPTTEVSSISRSERLFAAMYLHFGTMVVAGASFIALYALLSLRAARA